MSYRATYNFYTILRRKELNYIFNLCFRTYSYLHDKKIWYGLCWNLVKVVCEWSSNYFKKLNQILLFQEIYMYKLYIQSLWFLFVHLCAVFFSLLGWKFVIYFHLKSVPHFLSTLTLMISSKVEFCSRDTPNSS